MFSFRLFRFPVHVNVDLGVNRVFRFQVFTCGRPLSFFRLLDGELSHVTVNQVGYLVVAVDTASMSCQTIAIEADGSNVGEGLLRFTEGIRDWGTKWIIVGRLSIRRLVLQSGSACFRAGILPLSLVVVWEVCLL